VEGLAAVTADLRYSDTERELASALGDLLAAQSGWKDVLARTEAGEAYDASLWHAVASGVGCAGLLIPEPLGGAGASYRELATAAEQLGAAVAPVPYLGSAAVATTTLLSAATSTVHTAAGSGAAASLLRRLADGATTAALAVEFTAWPGAGFPTQVRLAGLRQGDVAAGVARLRGTVRSVADALPADVLLVPADGVPPGLYQVDATAEGVHRTPVVSLDMTRQLCDVTLDDAPGRSIASGEAAERAVADGLAAGAAILAAEQLGLAQRCLDMTVAYVKERRQFARPVGSFQGLKHRLADLWVSVTQARAASRYAAACLATGDEDAPVAVALAKAYCSEVATHAAEECVQMHGGIGFTWEHPAHLYLKRAKASSIAFGTPDAHRATLASLAGIPAP
jgi:alkylation response protein AidB-like acyl-CoA dehydrogenase